MAHADNFCTQRTATKVDFNIGGLSSASGLSKRAQLDAFDAEFDVLRARLGSTSASASAMHTGIFFCSFL